MEVVPSDLAFIELKDETNPLVLYNEWEQEAKQYVRRPNIMILATSSKDGNVSNRTVVLREILKDGSFTFLTQENSRKVQHLKENPKAALCITWLYLKENVSVSRQVRIEGIVEQLPLEKTKEFFDNDMPHGRIRNMFCQSGRHVDSWDELKKRHDEVRERYLRKENLELPEYVVSYKVKPEMFDFYYDYDTHIADRIIFKKEEDSWTWERVET